MTYSDKKLKRKWILQEYIRVIHYCEDQIHKKWGSPDFMPDMYEQILEVLKNEFRAPTTVKTRYLFKDCREKINDFPSSWREGLISDIVKNFDAFGEHFKNNEFIVNEECFDLPGPFHCEQRKLI